MIPWLHWVGFGASGEQERQFVIEIERDGRVGIDLKFGSIAFKEEAAGSYAVALVDVIVDDGRSGGTRVQMEVKVAADPEAESILGVTDKCRAHIAATLRAAADTFDTTTARELLFHVR